MGTGARGDAQRPACARDGDDAVSVLFDDAGYQTLAVTLVVERGLLEAT